MVKIEVNMVTPDCVAALELYEKIFDGIERVEVTSFEKGQNEAVFLLNDLRVHLLDENQGFGLFAPSKGIPQNMWLNVIVPDIAKTFKNAVAAGCQEISPISDMTDTFGVKNALFADPYGYIWMLHEIVRVVSFEDRVKASEEMMANEQNG